MTQKKNTVIFDLFNVLVRWRHEKAYAKVIADPQRLEFFLQNVIGSLPYGTYFHRRGGY